MPGTCRVMPVYFSQSLPPHLRRIGVIGPLTFEQHAPLAARFGKVVSLNRAYARLRAVKSTEEIDWLRIGAALSDRGISGLRDGLKPGLSERQLGDLIERTYVAE